MRTRVLSNWSKIRPKPVLQFKIRPLSSSLYSIVHVFQNQKDMIRAVNRSNEIAGSSTRCNRNTLGVTQTFTSQEYTSSKNWRTLPYIANVYLYQGALTNEIISHELEHVLLHWSIRNRTLEKVLEEKAQDKTAERVCYAFGQIHDQVFRNLRRANLIP